MNPSSAAATWALAAASALIAVGPSAGGDVAEPRSRSASPDRSRSRSLAASIARADAILAERTAPQPAQLADALDGEQVFRLDDQSVEIMSDGSAVVAGTIVAELGSRERYRLPADHEELSAAQDAVEEARRLASDELNELESRWYYIPRNTYVQRCGNCSTECLQHRYLRERETLTRRHRENISDRQADAAETARQINRRLDAVKRETDRVMVEVSIPAALMAEPGSAKLREAKRDVIRGNIVDFAQAAVQTSRGDVQRIAAVKIVASRGGSTSAQGKSNAAANDPSTGPAEQPDAD